MSGSENVRALLLAAGLGTRLQPLTDNWPKCLMPIGGRPLMEYWLQALYQAGIQEVCVNLHHHAAIVAAFLERPQFNPWVHPVYEPRLLGTASSVRANSDFLANHTILLIHADNWSDCDLTGFMAFHRQQRPQHCAISMMTFTTDNPQSCGIVETDIEDVIVAFHEKVAQPPGNRANAAVYLLQPEVLQWLQLHPHVTDFSTEVLPHFVGRIACWHNPGIHRDIGTLPALQQAQQDPLPELVWPQVDSWQQRFFTHPVQHEVSAPADIRVAGGGI